MESLVNEWFTLNLLTQQNTSRKILCLLNSLVMELLLKRMVALPHIQIKFGQHTSLQFAVIYFINT